MITVITLRHLCKETEATAAMLPKKELQLKMETLKSLDGDEKIIQSSIRNFKIQFILVLYFQTSFVPRTK